MDQSMQKFIQNIIDKGKDLTLATIRPDGYPQATTLSYANSGLTIYVGIGRNSQKANNVRHCNKVSLTINGQYEDWDHIQGISMGGSAEIMSDSEELRHATACIINRFPQVAEFARSPEAAEKIAILKITPQVISVLDYEKGFGHTELVTV